MKNLAWHITMKLTDHRVLVRSPAERRALSRCVWARGVTTADVLTFRSADTHVHLLYGGDRKTAGRLAHDIEVSMRWQLELPIQFEPARIPPVGDQNHLRRSFDYVVRQDLRHSLDADPLHEGGNLLDLLGMRVAGLAAVASVRKMLPRIDRAHLVSLFREGLPGVPESAFSEASEFAEAGLEQLYEAACSAGCVRQLEGRNSARMAAKIAAVQVGSGFAPTRRVARILGICPSRVRRMRQRDVDPRLITAIRRQLHLRAHLPQVPRPMTNAEDDRPGPSSALPPAFARSRPTGSRVRRSPRERPEARRRRLPRR